jgi:hypothetical protein
MNNHRVQVLRLVLSTEGAHLEFVRCLGHGMGAGAGELNSPTYMELRETCMGWQVYVAEFGNKRLSVFDIEGEFIRHLSPA